MSKKNSAVEQLHALKLEFAAKQSEILNSALAELNEQLKEAKSNVTRIESEIAELSGSPVEGKVKGQRLSLLEEGSEEWNKVAGQIKIVLKNYKDGLNGRAIAKKLGLTDPKAIRRIQPVIHATTRREGQGAATRFHLE